MNSVNGEPPSLSQRVRCSARQKQTPSLSNLSLHRLVSMPEAVNFPIIIGSVCTGAHLQVLDVSLAEMPVRASGLPLWWMSLPDQAGPWFETPWRAFRNCGRAARPGPTLWTDPIAVSVHEAL